MLSCHSIWSMPFVIDDSSDVSGSHVIFPRLWLCFIYRSCLIPHRHPNLVGWMLKTKKTAGIASIHPPFQTLTVVILWVTHRKMWDHNLLKQCRLLMHVPCSLQGGASFHSRGERVTISFLMKFRNKAIVPINTRGFVGRFICPTETNKFHCPKDGTYTVEMLGFCWTICWLVADITLMRIVRIQWFNSTAIYQ